MTRFFVFAIVAVALVVPLAATGGAIAQEANESTTDDNSTVAFDVDDDVRVLGYDYDSDEQLLAVEVENRGQVSSTLHLVEIVERGSESWAWEDIRLDAGETTTVEIGPVQDRNGREAVMVATDDSLDEQRIEWIPTGERSEWFDGPATWGLTGLAVAVSAFGTFWGTKRYLEKQKAELEERQVEVVR